MVSKTDNTILQSKIIVFLRMLCAMKYATLLFLIPLDVIPCKGYIFRRQNHRVKCFLKDTCDILFAHKLKTNIPH